MQAQESQYQLMLLEQKRLLLLKEQHEKIEMEEKIQEESRKREEKEKKQRQLMDAYTAQREAEMKEEENEYRQRLSLIQFLDAAIETHDQVQVNKALSKVLSNQQGNIAILVVHCVAIN